MSKKPGKSEPLEKNLSSGKILRQIRRTMALVWRASPFMVIALCLLTLIAGGIPAGAAYVGKLIIDGIVHDTLTRHAIFALVILEGVFAVSLITSQRALNSVTTLLRTKLGQVLSVDIMRKALTLETLKFDDSDFLDRMGRARGDATARPLSLVQRIFMIVKSIVMLATFTGILWQFSPYAILLLVFSGLPPFFAGLRFSGTTFEHKNAREHDKRRQAYFSMLLTRAEFVKEIKLYELGENMLARFEAVFKRLYGADRKLIVGQTFWGTLLNTTGAVIMVATSLWFVSEALDGNITVGDMTMYIAVLRQGQNAVGESLESIGGVYEDNLYLSNLFDFIDSEQIDRDGTEEAGNTPGDGIRFENVSFSYPGTNTPAVHNLSLHIKPGHIVAVIGENGSGKTTFIKLLTRLILPDSGTIRIDGRLLEEWKASALARRVGVIFQDFNKYQLTAGENIGAGQVDQMNSEELWREAARRAAGDSIIESLPQGYHTFLGKKFQGGQELSGGQWQRVALARAFMRQGADILVLDEPTAMIDVQAEARIFERVKQESRNQIVILISHRFSNVRLADRIIVMDKGTIIESGSHEELLQRGGRYAEMFNLQAGYYT